jgi:inner membrane protein
MDSLTQIVLGAAVAEASLGKKIGNRAMVWGAIAGTLPDMDVIANGLMSPVDALAFHRGPTHSALYLFIAAFVLGWVVFRMYQLPFQRWFGIVGWGILTSAIGLIIVFLGTFSLGKLVTGLAVILLSAWIIYKRYSRPSYSRPTADLKDWIIMFLWVLITHPILDCFTTYGTQILLPFSNQRVAFNNIAVADPLYTVPFLICLIIVIYYPKHDRQRAVWNRRGLIISCLYMALTIFNKTRINTIFENSISRAGIEANRYTTSPTILNNILWSGVAETDSAYYYGSYSFFDEEKFFKLNKLPKSRPENPDAFQSDHTLKILRWFSDDYFNIVENKSDSIQYYDLRFGTFRMKTSDPDQFVFKFNLTKNDQGEYILKDQGERPRDANFREAFSALWDRILGNSFAGKSETDKN